ncbi:MAG: L-fucose/L-arabinose isomerase family protein [Christensenellales bacterium]
MNIKRRIKIGFIPVRREVFDAQEPIKQNLLFLDRFNEFKGENIELVTIEDIVEGGIAFGEEHIAPVIDKMKRMNVDGIFFPHTNFGVEEVTARISRELGLPVLIWGNRDEGPDSAGKRLRDTQCGLFAVTKVLQRFNIPFSYIINCDIDDSKVKKGFLEFCAACSVKSSFKKMRIAQLSTRPKPFLSVSYNEAELIERFGIHVVPISLINMLKLVDEMVASNDIEFKEAYDDIGSRFEHSEMDELAFKKMCAIKPVLFRMINEVNASALASECWMFRNIIKTQACAMFGELTDLGIPVACETDIHGAITSIMAQAAAFNQKTTFFADFTIRNPIDNNSELLWHCGNFSYSLKHPDDIAKLDLLGRAQFGIKHGPVTLSRLDSIKGNYRLFTGEGVGSEGIKSNGTYLWFKVNDWEKWEEKLIFGPYIHHCSGIYGNYSRILIEAAKYIPGLDVDVIESYRQSLGY